MSNRLPAADLPNMVAALRAERAEMLKLHRQSHRRPMNRAQRRSRMRIADVVAHIGATARSFYIPAGLRTSFAASLEQVNEGPVGRRRDRSRADVMAEYRRASRRATTLSPATPSSPPASSTP
ncbi:hypothetical protein [Streptomyces coeruleofuscus]|uniref:DinB family protein n=1 Tax=Streptomyces coeruleofuscus TaxID=66879 RepID=A0ABN3JBQ0_9ACTN